MIGVLVARVYIGAKKKKKKKITIVMLRLLLGIATVTETFQRDLIRKRKVTGVASTETPPSVLRILSSI